MSIPLDDQQLTRHNFRLLAEHLAILDSELQTAGFERGLREQLLLTWWRATIMGAPMSELAELFRRMLDDAA